MRRSITLVFVLNFKHCMLKNYIENSCLYNTIVCLIKKTIRDAKDVQQCTANKVFITEHNNTVYCRISSETFDLTLVVFVSNAGFDPLILDKESED